MNWPVTHRTHANIDSTQLFNFGPSAPSSTTLIQDICCLRREEGRLLLASRLAIVKPAGGWMAGKGVRFHHRRRPTP